MAVYGYCRVSTDKQSEEGESLGVQERQIQGWCMIAGETLTETFVEKGVSASIPLAKRPQGAALLAILRNGDTIVAARLDRVFRSALDALQTVEAMQKKKIRVIIIEGLGDITGNGMAKAFLTISAAFAELERDTIRERVTTVKADQRDRGRYLGGKVPFGFRVEEGALVEVPEEQAVTVDIRSMRASGLPLRTIQATVLARYQRKLSLDAISRVTKA
ncbi:MAG: recombinase family protein [Sphingobium sp.]